MASGHVQHMREERAALRVQCRWRAKNGGLAAHMIRQAKRDEAKEMDNAALLLQTRFRGHRAKRDLPMRLDRARYQCEQKKLNDAARRVQVRREEERGGRGYPVFIWSMYQSSTCIFFSYTCLSSLILSSTCSAPGAAAKVASARSSSARRGRCGTTRRRRRRS